MHIHVKRNMTAHLGMIICLHVYQLGAGKSYIRLLLSEKTYLRTWEWHIGRPFTSSDFRQENTTNLKNLV